MRLKLSSITAGCAGGLALLTALPALAAPCPTVDHAIYGSGGSAITADLKLIAIEFAKLAEPITIFYADIGGACPGLEYFTTGSATTAYKYWNAAGVEAQCDAPEVAPDFAHMGNPVEDCGVTLPDGIGDFQGPVQSLNIVTHKDSTYSSISAEALYFIYGFGPAAGQVAPWTTDGSVFVRQSNSFASLFLAQSINVPAEALYGLGTAQEKTTQGQVISGIGALAASADSTLGFVSGSAADSGGATVKTLAYQHYDQSCGYWPDSKSNTLDKINVRNGLYHLWAIGHFFAPTDTNGEIENPDVKNLVEWINGTNETPGPGDVNVLGKSIESGDIPLCAMRVKREGLLGAVSSFAPDKPCDCFFEIIATNKQPAYCEACSDDDDCSDPERPACNYGYCEAYRND